jgi:hypothetical protein
MSRSTLTSTMTIRGERASACTGCAAHLGLRQIDEATDEPGNAFVVVDTGPWVFGKKVMLPAG